MAGPSRDYDVIVDFWEWRRRREERRCYRRRMDSEQETRVCVRVRFWPLAAAQQGDSRGSFRVKSGHPNLAPQRQLMTNYGPRRSDFAVMHNIARATMC
jgi:hypothetical protein